MNLYYFTNTAIEANTKVGRDVLYKRVASIGATEEVARKGYPTQEPGKDDKGKPILVTLHEYLDDRYVLEGVYKLSKFWEVF